jgi:hypothetical protein
MLLLSCPSKAGSACALSFFVSLPPSIGGDLRLLNFARQPGSHGEEERRERHRERERE